jgi:DNA-binding transcriptional LysR family regulator
MLRIEDVRRVLSVSPAYLQERGEPATLGDLRHRDVILVENDTGPPCGWAAKGGHRAGTPRLSVNSVEAATAAAVSGLGIVRTLSYQVSDHVRCPSKAHSS